MRCATSLCDIPPPKRRIAISSRGLRRARLRVELKQSGHWHTTDDYRLSCIGTPRIVAQVAHERVRQRAMLAVRPFAAQHGEKSNVPLMHGSKSITQRASRYADAVSAFARELERAVDRERCGEMRNHVFNLAGVFFRERFVQGSPIHREKSGQPEPMVERKDAH